MRFYVAGKFDDRLCVRGLMDKLEELGHEITFDWTTEHYQNKEETHEDAMECFDGVGSADAFIGLFVNDLPYKGALVEMGAALGWYADVYIIGHAIDSCIFSKLATQQFENEEEFLGFIRNESS